MLQHGRPGPFLLPLFKAVFLTIGPLRHLKKEHGVESEGRIKCLEKNCKFSCRYTWQLRSHLMQEHAIQMESEVKEFSNGKGSVTSTT